MSAYESCILLTQQQNEYFKEFTDLQATAMSVNYSGSYVLLAGRRHLALQSLNNNDEELKKFHRNSKYEVSAAEFAICESKQQYCAIATSQLIEIVTWSPDPSLLYSLRAHTRSVTDIDWHPKQPLLLASCSIDTYTHLWDLNDPRKPILSLSAVCMSGATQVGFNRVSGNLIATAHDGDLRIWDIRKGSIPIQYITAHLARIHGINWSHKEETHLATASQDGTVKYFDINNPRRAERIISTHPSPVWRARYTPFADGLVTIIVPHLGRGENNLLLWNNSRNTQSQSAPICSFVGHTDVILDFAFRPNRNDANQDPELLTWSRDQTFRVWKVDDNLRQKLGQKSNFDAEEELKMDGFVSLQRSSADNKYAVDKSQPSCSLQHEFSLLNTNIPHIDVETLDPNKRNAMVRIVANGYVIILQVLFPLIYPNIQPEFEYCAGTSLDDTLSVKLMKVLKDTANHRVNKGRTCLEQCLRALVTELKKESGGDKGHIRLQSPRLEGALSGVLDACIPFPKSSGLCFGHGGLLVTFSRPLHTKRISLRQQTTTPRALSALSGGYLGNVNGSKPVLSYREPNSSAFYLPDRKASRSRGISNRTITSTVYIYDISRLIYVSKELAERYIIDTNNVVQMCRHNKKVSEEFALRPDLVQCWTLAESIAMSLSEVDTEDDILSSHNPFAKNLLESLINHFARIHDVQTAAMLCCAFGRHCPKNSISRSSSVSSKSNSPSVSPYHTILPVDTTQSFMKQTAWSLAQQLKQMRSNSWSDSLDDYRLGISDINRSLLGDSQRTLYDVFKKSYAEMLYCWGLLVQRAKILKYLSSAASLQIRGVEFVTECTRCKRTTLGPSCQNCKKPLLTCTLCRLPVRGAANACLNCGHGGHTDHLRKWFEKHDVCAFGCGCHCLEQSSVLIDL